MFNEAVGLVMTVDMFDQIQVFPLKVIVPLSAALYFYCKVLDTPAMYMCTVMSPEQQGADVQQTGGH